MKNLISYIKESLLDDEDVLMKDNDVQAYNSLLPQDWEMYKDSNYIIPKKMDGNNPFNLVLYKSDFDKIKSLNSTDLKFIPLKNLLIVNTNSLNLPLVTSTINLSYLNTDNHPLDLDFNKVNYNIDSIQILTTNIGKIIPYKKHINCVQLFINHRSNKDNLYKKDSICGWNCEHLFVCCDWDVSKNGSLNKEEVQNLVDNNPKSSKIYIYIHKEKVHQLLLNDNREIIGEYMMNYDEFRKIQSKTEKKYDRDIHKWLKSHHILVECCNAIPSNTIGIGNPMPPTDNSIGSEPLILRRKKRMNKIKKES